MARRRNISRPDQDGDRFTVLFTTLMLILVSFFVVLVSRANFDETKYAAAVTSIKSSLGTFSGGRLAIGVDEGLTVEGMGFDLGGRPLEPELEMARIRARLAPALLSREANIIHTRHKRVISLSAGLVFNLDSAELTPEAEDLLRSLAEALGPAEIPIAVEGHTDSHPSQTAGLGDNWDISGRRALAVLDFLANEAGVAPDRLTALAYAGTKPLRSNQTPQGRARNNRVDLVLDFSRTEAAGLDRLSERDPNFNFQGFDFPIRSNPEAEN